MYVSSASGAILTSAEGDEYVDLLGEYTAGLYGHSHPAIRRAIDGALDRGWSYGAQHEGEARLARLVRERFPSMELVRFTNSGTEANLMAVATAVEWTARPGVVVFEGGYHGAVLSFPMGCRHAYEETQMNVKSGANGYANGSTLHSQRASTQRIFGSPLNVPHTYHIARYNSLHSVSAIFSAHGSSIATILVEPVLGSGGAIPSTPAFLAHLRALAASHGALLIYDEVMTSRLHAGSGVQGTLPPATQPDLTTLGKYIGGGMSFGAFGGRADIMRMYDPRAPGALSHPGTFNNNVLTMAAGAAGLAEVFTPETAESLQERGEALRRRLNEVAKGTCVRVTGCGSIMCFHFCGKEVEEIETPEDASAGGWSSRWSDILHLEMLERGCYIARRGFVALSLALTEEDLDKFVNAVAEFVERYRAVLEAKEAK